MSIRSFFESFFSSTPSDSHSSPERASLGNDWNDNYGTLASFNQVSAERDSLFDSSGSAFDDDSFSRHDW